MCLIYDNRFCIYVYMALAISCITNLSDHIKKLNKHVKEQSYGRFMILYMHILVMVYDIVTLFEFRVARSKN